MKVVKILLKFQKEYLKEFLLRKKTKKKNIVVTKKYIDRMYGKHKIFNYSFLTSL